MGVLGPQVAGAQEIPDFDLRIDAPPRVSAEPDISIQFPATVVLESHAPQGNDESMGAQGWTLSIVAGPEARIAGATTVDTAGDDPPAGYFAEGFKITEITSGPENEGVISAVALSWFEPAFLPRNGESTLLHLTVETKGPAEGEGCRPVSIAFQDGLKGSGMPIHNSITYEGFPRKDDGSERDGDRDREENAEVLVCSRQFFLRGDCRPDKGIDLSDAVTSLQYLFLGGERPSCLAACDSNRDDSLDITDAIHTLNHLFLGGLPPPAPYPACGENPEPGRLSCEIAGC